MRYIVIWYNIYYYIISYLQLIIVLLWVSVESYYNRNSHHHHRRPRGRTLISRSILILSELRSGPAHSSSLSSSLSSSSIIHGFVFFLFPTLSRGPYHHSTPSLLYYILYPAGFIRTLVRQHSHPHYVTLKSSLSCVLVHPCTATPTTRCKTALTPCTAPRPASSIYPHIHRTHSRHHIRHRRPAHAHYVNTLGCFTAVIKEYPLANHYQTIQVPCVDLKINLISLYFALRV